MSIIRTKRKRHNFSIIDNTGLMDADLSWKATGLLAFLMTKPDGWHINISNLTTSKSDGRHSTRKALQELKDSGYVMLISTRNPEGKFEYEYLVFETPEDLQEWQLEQNSAHRVQKSDPVSDDQFTASEKPTRIIRRGKSDAIVNIDKEITDQEITNLSPPTSSQSLESLKPEEREKFEKFVREEWKKLGKGEVRNMSVFVSDNHFNHWYKLFQNSPDGISLSRVINGGYKWQEDPRYSFWVKEFTQRDIAWVNEASGAEREERMSFVIYYEKILYAPKEK